MNSVFSNPEYSKVIWHKLKNSINLTRFSIDNVLALGKENISDTAMPLLKDVQSFIERDFLVVENLSLLSRYENGTLKPYPEDVNLHEFISDIKQQVYQISKGMAAIAEPDTNYKNTVFRSDRKFLKVIFLNIVYFLNEIDHGKENKIGIAVNNHKSLDFVFSRESTEEFKDLKSENLFGKEGQPDLTKSYGEIYLVSVDKTWNLYTNKKF